MAVQAIAAGRHLRERHPDVERDAGLLGKHGDRPDLLQGGEKRIEQGPDFRRPALEVVLESVAAAGVGLIAVRERPPALPARPERTARAHEPPVERAGPRGGRGIQRGVVRSALQRRAPPPALSFRA